LNIKLNKLDPAEKRVFRIHMSYSFIEGIIMGVLALNEFVLIKSLKGSNFQIGVLFQLSVIMMLFSVLINEFLKRTRNKPGLLRKVALITRLPLLLLLFFPRSLEAYTEAPIFQYLFLIIFLLFYLANPIIFPSINLFLRTNYKGEHFGTLYSYATTLNKIVMLFATFCFGLLLDNDPYAYSYVYPVLAALGIVSVHLLSRIPFEQTPIEPKAGFLSSIKQSLVNMWEIITKNKPYRDFEIGFMLYGFAWMTTIAVITIFFDRVLNMNYTTVAFYKNAYNILAILILPFFGRLIGKIDPRKFAIYTFLSLLLFLLFLALTEYFPQSFEFFGIRIYYSLILAYLAHAVFAATMSLLWFIGSAYFAKDQDAANYQSVHLTLTGARGVFAPLVGVMFYELFGFTWTFGIAIISLGAAIIIMLVSLKTRNLAKQ
jgi:MFS family permease